jgi:nucleotide-binding universal stress UspA family protein
VTNDTKRPAAIPRDREWWRNRVLVDGGANAMAQGREWAHILGVELVVCRRRPEQRVDAPDARIVDVPRTFRAARASARLVVVDAADGGVRQRVRRARGPLLVAREGGRSGKVLVAVDVHDPAERALALVARRLRTHPAEVTVAFSVERGLNAAEWMANFGGSNEAFVPVDVEARKIAAATQLTELLDRYDLRGSVRVTDGPPVPLILDLADELRAELVVLGDSRHHGIWRVLRSTTVDEVAVLATTSVLVVPRR